MRHLKNSIKGFYMSLGMFTRLPLPFHIWDEKHTAVMISSFPIVGLVIGTLWWLWIVLLTFLNMPLMLAAALSSLAPFFIAGFIHLDGYMDTSDAILSYRDIKDRIRILKDPLVGAFAVVMLIILLLLQFSAVYSIVENGKYLPLVISISVISRCCSTFSIFTLRHMSESNYTPLLKEGTGIFHKVFVVVVGVVTTGLTFLYGGVVGLLVILAVILGYGVAIRKASKSLNGISGDLLGYAMVIGELSGLIALATLQGRWLF
jgi:adenosylcobinamide-GDP ribazoletransferase